jgi:hypothetical protein
MPLSPAVIGIGVRRDHEKQGRPFHSWANQPVQGIVGPSRPINFSLTDGATEGQRLLSHNVGVLLRGELGVETAIASGGFVYVGTDNAGEDDLWRFYNVTRGRDYIHLMFLRTLRFYLGRFNLTGQTIQAVLNTMGFAMRDLKADGDILGYEVKFTRDQNSAEELRQRATGGPISRGSTYLVGEGGPELITAGRSGCLEKAGFSSTRKLNARSYLTWGEKVTGLEQAREGDVVIFTRGSSAAQGHVAFFHKATGSQIEVLGGNQSDGVTIARYAKSRLLGIRRPLRADVPQRPEMKVVQQQLKDLGYFEVGIIDGRYGQGPRRGKGRLGSKA